MRSSIAVAVAVAALGCNAPVGPPIDASNAATCDCHLEGSGLEAILVMSWSCYCAAYGDGCTRELASACTDFRERFDYPGCGLTDLRGVPAIVPSDDVFDQDGKLVGARIASDTTAYRRRLRTVAAVQGYAPAGLKPRNSVGGRRGRPVRRRWTRARTC